jgi:hypothetical protein
MDSSLSAPVAFAAMPAIRTAVTEIRQPGSGRAQWSFLTNRRAAAAGAAAALLLSVAGWRAGGYTAMAWAVLAGTLVAYIVDLSTGQGALTLTEGDDGYL